MRPYYIKKRLAERKRHKYLRKCLATRRKNSKPPAVHHNFKHRSANKHVYPEKADSTSHAPCFSREGKGHDILPPRYIKRERPTFRHPPASASNPAGSRVLGPTPPERENHHARAQWPVESPTRPPSQPRLQTMYAVSPSSPVVLRLSRHSPFGPERTNFCGEAKRQHRWYPHRQPRTCNHRGRLRARYNTALSSLLGDRRLLRLPRVFAPTYAPDGRSCNKRCEKERPRCCAPERQGRSPIPHRLLRRFPTRTTLLHRKTANSRSLRGQTGCYSRR